jgi:predicted TIM-barrel fold metal-dependent hydrolase
MPLIETKLFASLPFIGRSYTEWSPENAIGMMDDNGIRASVLSMIALPLFASGDPPLAQRLARRSNELAASAISQYPNRFGAFACLPLPDVDNALSEVSYSLDTLELDGVLLLTNSEGVYVGDDRLDPILSELNRRNALVFLHPASPACAECVTLGYSPSLVEAVFDTTRAIMYLGLGGYFARYPNIRFIVAHAGGTLPFIIDRIETLSKIFVPQISGRTGGTLTSLVQNMYFELTLSTSAHSLASILNLVEPNHLLFGTDWPLLGTDEIKRMIRDLQESALIDDKELALIEHETALGLFGRLRSTTA